MNLRADGVTKIADQLPKALSNQPTASAAIQRIAGQMQAFLASDVVYSQRVRAADPRGARRQRHRRPDVATSKFLPTIGWLDPTRSATSSTRTPTRRRRSSSGEIKPGTHGHGLISVTAVGTTLNAHRRQPRARPRRRWPLDVTYANQGENDETNVKIIGQVTGERQQDDHVDQDASTRPRPDAGHGADPADVGAAAGHLVDDDRHASSRSAASRRPTTTSRPTPSCSTRPAPAARALRAGGLSSVGGVDSSTAGIVAVAGCAVALAALVVASVGAGPAAAAARRPARAARAPAGGGPRRARRADRAGVPVAARLRRRRRGAARRPASATAEDRLDGAIAFRGLVRFDAYNEMSGQQSMSIALLDAEQSGLVLSSIHHRDQARLYAKHVVRRRARVPAVARGDRGGARRAGGRAAAGAPAAAMTATRLGYLGPAGTFTHAALLASGARVRARPSRSRPSARRSWPRPRAARSTAALVPIENSLEGGVNATLDALALRAPRTPRSWARRCCRSPTR